MNRGVRFVWVALALGVALFPALLLPAAALAREVNVYSYRQPFLIQPIFEAFERKSGIRVNVVFAPKGMLERMRQEGRNSPADLVLTTEVALLHDAAEAGLLQAVKSPALEASVPAPYRHPDGLWYGLTMRARIVFASRERVPPGELSTYEALSDPRWRGRICTRSSQHDYNVALLASLIAHHGEEQATAWARGLLANLARKPQGNDRAQVKAIKEGECDLALVNTYYMGKMLDDPEQRSWAEAVYLFFPNQDGRGAHVNISGAGVARHAPHRAEAIALLEFLAGEEAQRLYAGQNHEYPVQPGVPWSDTVAAWGRFKADALPLADLARYRNAAIRIYDRVGFP